jgi:hypothetical protein
MTEILQQIILIDYENVQDFDLSSILDQNVLIKVFHGESQKFSGEFVDSALKLGKDRIEMVEISGNGKNALDFHIAYYIGKYSKEISDAEYTIISKDTGFKPLIKHLNQKEKITATLKTSIAETTIPKRTIPAQGEDIYKLVLERLSSSKIPKPKKKLTLRNQIINICKKKIDESKAEEIIEKLIASGFIRCTGESVSYNDACNVDMSDENSDLPF